MTALTQPQSLEEALTLALVLGLTAATDEEYERVLPLIEEFSAGLDELSIARCKRAALKHLDMEDAA